MTSVAHSARILFVDDEQHVLDGLRRAIASERPRWCALFENDPQSAISRMQDEPFNVLVSDLHMPRMDGLDLIAAASRIRPSAAFMLLTGAGDYEAALRAINTVRVARFLTKPCPASTLVDAIESVLPEPSKTDAVDVHDECGGLALAALELFATAVIVVDAGTGGVAFANREGERKLSTPGSGLERDAQGVLRALTPEATRDLGVEVQAASHEGASPRFFGLPRPNGDRPLTAIARAIGNYTGSSSRVALLISDPDDVCAPEPDALSALFDLSRAEALIAHVLAHGGDVAEAAEASGVTVESARTYLKRIYAKTGLTGQRELVRLVLSAPRLAARHD